MINDPRNNIHKTNLTHYGKGLGLVPGSANFQHCREALEYVTGGHLVLTDHYYKCSISGDKTEEANTMLAYIRESLSNPTLKELPLIPRLATIINQLATHLDQQNPQTIPGVPSRMQMLWQMQHDPEIRKF